MTFRSTIILLLSIFVFTCLVFLGAQEIRRRGQLVSAATPTAESLQSMSSSESATPDRVSRVSSKVIAYYFHVTVRCPTCRKIEAFSDESLKEGFSEDLRAGRLEWRVVNLQYPENRHFIQDYQLFTKSLVIVRRKDGKQVEWKNLERVWELTDNKDQFVRYVQAEVRAYLEKS